MVVVSHSYYFYVEARGRIGHGHSLTHITSIDAYSELDVGIGDKGEFLSLQKLAG